ncbi:pentapeptide repeat-containing protein [Nostoc sp. FACHB-888]|uniref:pentapeptide repeat-containing protein n=1 Tax=Nostoc sp. FACHB-888 TaxID=2692842 RepID=UPI001F54A21F|nr:pentapeptide repeat-containing protein [Nostoc sp. FACHB-888]
MKRPKVALEDFSEVNLIGGNFREVTFSGSFRRANFRNTNFSQASFRRVDIRESSFFRARFTEVNFEDANLFQTDFSSTTVYELELSNLRLNGAKLCNTDLSEKDINNTYLIEADLSSASLIGADLNDANLEKANLYKANLSNVNLTKVQALGTNFTGAIFTGACIEDWHINSETNLTDIICDHIYLRQGQQERRPSNGNFSPGEFTKLFQKSLETVDLIFRNGIDWDAFAYSFKKLEVENQGAQLDVQSIEKKGDGILVVRVAVSPDTDKAKIHSEFMQGYEFAAKALEAQYQARLEDKDKRVVGK